MLAAFIGMLHLSSISGVGPLFEGSEGEWINIGCAVKFMGQGVWRGIVGTIAHDMELGIKGVLLIEMHVS